MANHNAPKDAPKAAGAKNETPSTALESHDAPPAVDELAELKAKLADAEARAAEAAAREANLAAQIAAAAPQPLPVGNTVRPEGVPMHPVTGEPIFNVNRPTGRNK